MIGSGAEELQLLVYRTQYVCRSIAYNGHTIEACFGNEKRVHVFDSNVGCSL